MPPVAQRSNFSRCNLSSSRQRQAVWRRAVLRRAVQHILNYDAAGWNVAYPARPGMDDTERLAIRIEGLDPHEPAVLEALGFVRSWTTSLALPRP